MVSQKKNDLRNAAIALALMALLGVALIAPVSGLSQSRTRTIIFLRRAPRGATHGFLSTSGDARCTPRFTLCLHFWDSLRRDFSPWESAWRLPGRHGVSLATCAWSAHGLSFLCYWGSQCFLNFSPTCSPSRSSHSFSWSRCAGICAAGRGAGMLAASLLPLARPEGVFLCLLWGVWVVAKDIDPTTSPASVGLSETHSHSSFDADSRPQVFFFGGSQRRASRATRSLFCITGRRPGIKTSMVAAHFSATVSARLEFTGMLLAVPFVTRPLVQNARAELGFQ